MNKYFTMVKQHSWYFYHLQINQILCVKNEQASGFANMTSSFTMVRNKKSYG